MNIGNENQRCTLCLNVKEKLQKNISYEPGGNGKYYNVMKHL